MVAPADDILEKTRALARELERIDPIGRLIVNTMVLIISVVDSGLKNTTLPLKIAAAELECSEALDKDGNRQEDVRFLLHGSCAAVFQLIKRFVENRKANVETLEDWRAMAHRLSGTNMICNLLRTSLGLIVSVINTSTVNSKTLLMKIDCLSQECKNEMNEDQHRNDDYHSLHYSFISSICFLLQFLVGTDEEAERVAAAAMENAVPPAQPDQLFVVNGDLDDEINGFEDEVEDAEEEKENADPKEEIEEQKEKNGEDADPSSNEKSDEEANKNGKEEEKTDPDYGKTLIAPSVDFTKEDEGFEKLIAGREKYKFLPKNIWKCAMPKSEHLPDPKTDSCESLKGASIACPLDCREGERCRNNFRKKNPKIYLGRTSYGPGIFAAEPIKMESFCKILEYRGVIRTNAQWKDHLEKMKKKNRAYGRYVVQLDGEYTCDPEQCGNSGRMSNHSCEPNCSLELFYVDGIPHLFLIPLRNIEKGEQLVWFYGGKFAKGKDVVGDEIEKIPCGCKSTYCQGIVGGIAAAPTKITKTVEDPKLKKKMETRNKKRKESRRSNIKMEVIKKKKEEENKKDKHDSQKSSRMARAGKRGNN